MPEKLLMIRLTPKNKKKLAVSSKTNFRSIPAEVNAIIAAHFAKKGKSK